MKHFFWLSLILGLWLIALPYAVGFASVSAIASGNNMLVGVLIALCSIWTLMGASGLAGVSAFQALTSIWLIASPFALQYQTVPHAMANDVVIGIVTLLVSLGEEWSLGHTHVPLHA